MSEDRRRELEAAHPIVNEDIEEVAPPAAPGMVMLLHGLVNGGPTEHDRRAPKRPDGKPNRPLTAFTVSFVPVKEAE